MKEKCHLPLLELGKLSGIFDQMLQKFEEKQDSALLPILYLTSAQCLSPNWLSVEDLGETLLSGMSN